MNKLYNDTAVQAIANAIRTKNGSSDTYTIAEMSTALNDLSYYAKPTISNVALATFEADGLSLNKLKVAINAVQDLHGFDHPWVGGAGKNKLPLTVDEIKRVNSGRTWIGNSTEISGVLFTINTDSDGNVVGISTSGTATTLIQFPVTGAIIPSTFEGKVLNGCPSGGSTGTYRLLCLESGTSKAIDTGSGATISGISTNNNIEIRINANTNMSGKVFYPMIRNSSESDTFAPYSNICPISGWDAANVSDVGKNLFDKNNVNEINGYVPVLNGTLEQGATEHSIYLWLPKGTYTFQRIIPSTDITNKRFYVRRYDNVPQVGDVGDVVADYNNELTGTFTINKDGYVLIFMFNGSTAWNARQEVFDSMQIELGSTATTYEPYNGVTTTISLPQTVYGGELDVVNGVLTVTSGYIASYDGETLPSTWISDRDVYAEGTSPTTGAEVCYELAEPIIINLTPSLIKSLNGQNNISVDSGDIIELEYFKEV